MGFLEAIIMGITQGLTEFLPVSSSGHLALIEHIFSFKPENLVFEVGVHLGTVLSILTIYRKVIWAWCKDIFQFLRTFQLNDGAYLFFVVVVASLPTALVGLLFRKWIEQAFANLLVVGLSFLFTGGILFWVEKKSSNKNQPDEGLDNFSDLSNIRCITPGKAFFIGAAQAVAILPGVSRSGSTIAMGLFLGVPRGVAALFSFLMSVPVILGASWLQWRDVEKLSTLEIQSLVLSIAVSFVFGLVGLLLILYFVKKAQLDRFSWYLWVLGLGSIFVYFTGG